MTTNQLLMSGKKGLVMGLANDKSIAWGICQALNAQGAQLAISYQNEVLEKRVAPLAAQLDNEPLLIKCDVSDSASVEACFKELGEKWGKIDFVVHAIAFSDKNELKGRTIDTTLANFTNTMHISCYSFIEACRCASPIMNEGGSILTLTYLAPKECCPTITSWALPRPLWKLPFVLRRWTWAGKMSVSTPFPPVRSKRSPRPASAISARSCTGTN